MVDLSKHQGDGLKSQRAFHLDDPTHDRLRRAAVMSSSTMSQVLTRLIWEDLRLPDDGPVDDGSQTRLDLGDEIESYPPAQPIDHRAADIAALEGRGERDRDGDFDLG